jgi:predicted aldo/keto reductase-like oxidoreductase
LPCPEGVDIPTCFSCYNDTRIEGKWAARIQYLMQTSFKKKTTNASLCTQCGRCEKDCPQNIAIRQQLKQAAKTLEGPIYRGARFFVKKFMRI